MENNGTDRKLVHPNHGEVIELIDELNLRADKPAEIVEKLRIWFDANISYGRLCQPFYPLQRSDLDVLRLREGTCGDYANLAVSVFQTLGYEAGFAHVTRDCRDDPQEHICGAVRADGVWKLVDLTQPYRKWNCFDCQHSEYTLMDVEQYEQWIAKEEDYWTEVANKRGMPHLAGLLYAPWIHEDVVVNDDGLLESVFFLLNVDRQNAYTLSVYDLVYTLDSAYSPVMCIITKERTEYRFSVRKAENIWDEKQWSDAVGEDDIPVPYRTPHLERLLESVKRTLPVIDSRIIKQIRKQS